MLGRTPTPANSPLAAPYDEVNRPGPTAPPGQNRGAEAGPSVPAVLPCLASFGAYPLIPIGSSFPPPAPGSSFVPCPVVARPSPRPSVSLFPGADRERPKQTCAAAAPTQARTRPPTAACADREPHARGAFAAGVGRCRGDRPGPCTAGANPPHPRCPGSRLAPSGPPSRRSGPLIPCDRWRRRDFEVGRGEQRDDAQPAGPLKHHDKPEQVRLHTGARTCSQEKSPKRHIRPPTTNASRPDTKPQQPGHDAPAASTGESLPTRTKDAGVPDGDN